MVLENIINHYNHSENDAVHGLSPGGACKAGHKPPVGYINIEKNKVNNVESDFNAGDGAKRNIGFNDKYSKGSDPKWSDKTFPVVSTHGNTAIFNDKSILKTMHILTGSHHVEDMAIIPLTIVRKLINKPKRN